MARYFTREQLYRLRNEIRLESLFGTLGWPHKQREGRWCFRCPRCGELLAVVNPRTNLGRCFRCEENFNTIDLVMRITSCDFVAAVHFLEQHFPSTTSVNP